MLDLTLRDSFSFSRTLAAHISSDSFADFVMFGLRTGVDVCLVVHHGALG